MGNPHHQADVAALYQEIILEHAKRPRFKTKAAACQFCQEGKNPLCGDEITVFCQWNGADKRLSVTFEGSGCSISQASASMMCSVLQKVTREEALGYLRKAEEIYTGKWKGEEFEEDFEALAGVGQFPVRVKCAALPWKTMELLLSENFEADGTPRAGCEKLNQCPKGIKALKIVSTE